MLEYNFLLAKYLYTPQSNFLCWEESLQGEVGGCCDSGLRWQQSRGTVRAAVTGRCVTGGVHTALASTVFFPFEANTVLSTSQKNTQMLFPREEGEKKKTWFPSWVYQNHLQCHFSAMGLFHRPQLHVNEQSGSSCLTRAGRSQHLSSSAPTLLHTICRDCSWNCGKKRVWQENSIGTQSITKSHYVQLLKITFSDDLTGLLHVVPTIIVKVITWKVHPGLCVLLSKPTSSFTPAKASSPIYLQPCNTSNWASASPKCESKLCFAPAWGHRDQTKGGSSISQDRRDLSQEPPSCLSHHILHNRHIFPF